jgi:hypothetical protein
MSDDNYLGGMTIVSAGWLGPQAVYVDFITQYEVGDGWLFQLYANRTLVGATAWQDERRIIGQVLPSGVPTVLTLLRVDAEQITTDFGSIIPAGPWNRYQLRWSESGGSPDLHHWDITQGADAGDSPDPSNVIGRVPYYGDRDYSFVLPPFETPGTWKYAITPRDDAQPLGNAGTPVEVDVVAAVPPPDVAFEGEDTPRFTASIAGGVLTAAFSW